MNRPSVVRTGLLYKASRKLFLAFVFRYFRYTLNWKIGISPLHSTPLPHHHHPPPHHHHHHPADALGPRWLDVRTIRKTPAAVARQQLGRYPVPRALEVRFR